VEHKFIIASLHASNQEKTFQIRGARTKNQLIVTAKAQMSRNRKTDRQGTFHVYGPTSATPNCSPTGFSSQSLARMS
jgi:hypothetical protein